MSEFDDGWRQPKPDRWEEADPWIQYGTSTAPIEQDETTRSYSLRGTVEEVAVWGAVVVAVAAGAAYAFSHKGQAVINELKPVPEAVPLSPSCLPPTQKALSTVERLFTEPVAKARAEYRQLSLTGYEPQGSLMQPNLFDSNPTAPVNAELLLQETRPFFEKYGVDVQIAPAGTKKYYGLGAPSDRELSNYQFYGNVMGLVGGLSEVPPHYVLMSGLKTIRLMAGPRATDFAWKSPSTIDWNINTHNSDPLDYVPYEFGIALGHLTVDRLCGPDGAAIDPGFEALNNGPFPPSPLAPAETIYQNQSQTPELAADLANYRAGFVKNPADVKIADQRAAADMVTDKAELLAFLAEPSLVPSAMSPNHPVLRAKLLYTLAELYRRQPAVVRRLAVKASYYPIDRLSPREPAGNQHDQPYHLPHY